MVYYVFGFFSCLVQVVDEHICNRLRLASVKDVGVNDLVYVKICLFRGICNRSQ